MSERSTDIVDYFLSQKTQTRLNCASKNIYLSDEDAEDFKQDYAIAILEGKSQHQTIDQFGKDWLEKQNANKRKCGRINGKGKASELPSPQAGIDIKHDAKEAFVSCLRFLSHFGLSHEEIGSIFNMHPSRVSQVICHGGYIKERCPRVEKHILKKEAEKKYKSRALILIDEIRRLRDQRNQLMDQINNPENLSWNSINMDEIQDKIMMDLKSKGLTQKSMSRLMGVSEKTIRNRLKKGKNRQK